MLPAFPKHCYNPFKIKQLDRPIKGSAEVGPEEGRKEGGGCEQKCEWHYIECEHEAPESIQSPCVFTNG